LNEKYMETGMIPIVGKVSQCCVKR